jgi:ribosome-associated heat shock protein Hsp15
MADHARIDKWLWHARFYRSRVKAQEAAASGLIRLNGARVQKPSADVRPGDVVTLPRGREILAVRIEGISARRSNATEGQRLYKILPEPS